MSRPSTPGRSRRPLIIAAAILAGWLMLAGVAAPFAAKLSALQKNDLADFLPASAEATQVLRLESGFQNARVLPAVVVFERSTGITDADRATVTAEASRFAGLKGVVGEASPVIPSADGKALEVVVNVDSSSIGGISNGVASLRNAVRGSPGLAAHVTGPAGLAADFGAAFKALDVKLLVGTTVVVVVVLLLVYRSPILWAVPLAAVGVALIVAQAAVYFTARYFGLSSNGQSQGILTVLVFGAGTDYALLMISRYREELRRHETPYAAITAAVRGAAPAILASGTTVILALLCLLFSDLGSNKSLGPTAAFGIASAMLAMLTVLPAVLVLTGRRLFWPLTPRFESVQQPRTGFWARFASIIGRRSHAWWAVSALVLAVMTLGITRLDANGIAATDQYTVTVDSVAGQQVADRHFPAGSGSPAVVIANAGEADGVLATARSVSGVSDAAVLTTGPASTDPKVVGGKVLIDVTLKDSADSAAAKSTVDALRTAVHAVPGAEALVGGTTATDLDTQVSATHDLQLIVPLVLAVILVILVVLLRSLLAPVLLVATVILSFAATLGVSGVVFSSLFHFSGADSSFPLTAFVFLTALGIDYNIFLMTRVREEARRLGTRRGVLTGVSSTGTVITSAGIVLAATFSVFGVLPLVIFAELGFAVAFGVLLDTLIVRTVLVPALVHDVGARVWWPSRLAADSVSSSGIAPLEVADTPARDIA
ncbi:MAG TPA: MMPL family transporter [Candidatus Dormibacteraeota bacterium]|nr:MMPL family transporter [Candidatus Dormibacteraeota bacterium]